MLRKAYGLAAVVAVSSLTLSACGGSVSIGGGKTLDNDQLQSSLTTQLSKSAGVEAASISITCPDGQDVKKGHTFTCSLTDKSDGTTHVVKVVETDDKGGFDASVGTPPTATS